MPGTKADCSHNTLTFGSGDYYLFCDQCGARWCRISIRGDIPAPEEANNGYYCLDPYRIRIIRYGEGTDGSRP